MSDTYTKLFRSIAASTIVSEPLATRWLWVTMLSQVDRQGCVYGSIPGMARMANITIAEVEEALGRFMSPDPYSRTPDHEGRRIEEIDGGWRLLNYAKYDAMRNEAERKEYKREWDRRNRPSGHQRTKSEDGDTSDQARQSDSSPTQSDQTRQSDPMSHVSCPIEESSNEDSRASADADAPGGRDRIPYQAIVDAYNRTLTGLPRVREITAKRRTLIRSAWKASPQRRSPEFWSAYLAECQDDDFLNGTGPYREPHANWRPSFDYLLRADVVTKVFERAMDRMERGE